jgi:hypothetical protein
MAALIKLMEAETHVAWEQRGLLATSHGSVVLHLPAGERTLMEQALAVRGEVLGLLGSAFVLHIEGRHVSKRLWQFYNVVDDRRLRLSVDLNRTAEAGEHLSVTIPTLSWRLGRVVLPADTAAAVDAVHRLRGIGYGGVVVAGGEDAGYLEAVRAAIDPPKMVKPAKAAASKVEAKVAK